MSVSQGLAAFLMTLAACSAGSFYGSMSGFYIEKFQDKSFYIHMLLCFCAPQPLVSFIQKAVDGYFDERLSTRVTYGFRLIGMQVIVGLSVVLWMYAPETQFSILIIGVLLGFFQGVVVSSSSQMVAAMKPGFTIYARLGMHVSSLLTTFILVCSGFHPAASHSKFQMVLLPTVCMCALVAIVLSYMHFKTEVFDKAYSRLAYDLNTGDSLDEAGMVRQVTETSALKSDDGQLGVPSWVQYWLIGNGLCNGLEFFIASLVGFYGDASTAQTLTLLRLCLNLVGRLGALPVPYMPCFEEGPWHKVMATTIIFVLGASVVCMSKAFGSLLPERLFTVAWCIVPIFRTFASSLVDVTTASYTQVRNRKAVARSSEMIGFSSVLIGLGVGQATGRVLQHLQSSTLS